MPNKRVYELAKELGYNKHELMDTINSLKLGFTVANVMTKLSEDDVDKVKKALKKTSGSKPVKKKKKTKAASEPLPAGAEPVVRRRSSKKSQDEGDAEAAVDVSNMLSQGESGVRIIRRKRKVVSEESEVEQETHAPTPEDTAPETEPAVVEASVEDVPETPEVQPEVAVVSEPEAPAEVVVDAVVEETPVVSEAPADDTTEDATVVSPEPKEDVTPEKDVAVAEVPDTKETPVVATPEVAAPVAAVQPPAQTTSKKKNRGAKVLGRIDLDTINERMDTTRFDSGQRGGAEDDSAGGRRSKRRRSSVNMQEPASQPSSGRGRGRGNRSVRDHASIYDKGRGRGRGKKNKKENRPKKTEITVAAEHKRVVRIEDTITVGELGREMGVKAGMLALKLMELGVSANVNTTLDYDTASLIAEQFQHTIENVAFDISNFYDTSTDEDGSQTPRPPIVTVMGHVDHGKTSLLDAIRSTSVTTGEAGGITQHIGAYTVQSESGLITFLDTPGHEAFTALRARGAHSTDIVVLVVAADDGVMPQTVEAINHSREAGVPIIVAVNKIDKVSANPDRVKQALVEYDLVPEAWGGTTLFVEVSALQRLNIDELMDTILLQAELQELEARADRDAQGIVLESRLDKGRGPLASVLVQRGSLTVGDIVVIGAYYGRVRNMVDHRGETVEIAGPSIPVEITGLNGVPEAGEPFFVVQEEKDAKRITQHVAEQNRQKHMARLALSNMEAIRHILTNTEGEHKKLKTIIKGDVQGSIEALRHAFSKIGNEEVSIDVIHAAVGGVTENDVNLAASSSDEAVVIIGFNVRPDNRASEVAEKYGIEIMTFNIIYDVIDSMSLILEGLLSPVEKENVIGTAEVRDTFNAPKVGTIAGLYVTDGFLRRNARARLLRDGRIIYDSTLSSLRRFKDDVKEVQKGFECGASIHNYNDIKVGDVIEAYEVEEVAATF